ncbi:MAG: CobW-like GTP-binding protein, partial [Pirellulales bacterium]|nr:CobW-like GTP-binding protein [Pirellulales bacterium]
MTLKNVPTNVITGFLGSGKSTAILSLLAQKPQDETWAVLVNEFGEIGVDGGLIQHTSSSIKKV